MANTTGHYDRGKPEGSLRYSPASTVTWHGFHIGSEEVLRSPIFRQFVHHFGDMLLYEWSCTSQPAWHSYYYSDWNCHKIKTIETDTESEAITHCTRQFWLSAIIIELAQLPSRAYSEILPTYLSSAATEDKKADWAKLRLLSWCS